MDPLNETTIVTLVQPLLLWIKVLEVSALILLVLGLLGAWRLLATARPRQLPVSLAGEA
jgi:hypothetical protein